MSKELELKSGTVKVSSKRIAGVRLNYDFIAWGINTSQLSEQMNGLKLVWNGDQLVVSHSAFPGQEKWVFPGGIKEMTWKAE